MRRTALAVATGVIALSMFAMTPPASAHLNTASPVPGRFCKGADVGKKVKTVKYGIVLCAKDGDRARWIRK